ncbi:MAG: phosphatidylserine decarboxylase [Ruminococcus sp.]|nr:phosphatidylserine decarboxylase [Ruminococcus sp.]
MKIKKRNGEIIATNQKQNKMLKKLYGSVSGRMVLKFLTAPVISKAVGKYMESPLSKPLIKFFVRNNNIDTSQYIMKNFRSYNDFFTRKVKPEKRPVDYNQKHLISPCDSKVTAYKIKRNSIFRIKNSLYRVSDMLKNEFLARRYDGGYCLIYRLEVDDYHRYCYIDDGTKTNNVFISGELHTVNPIALEKYNIYKRNCREYTVLHTDNFGDVVQLEVGAMMVGKICNHHGEYSFTKGEEKGMFRFGGSTIVQLFEKDRIHPDSDILKNTRDGFETVVRYGEKTGFAL